MPKIIQMREPREDYDRAPRLVQDLRTFVLDGPYFHEGNNLCWLCDTGIVPDERHS